jgi:RNA polymerase sigma-70 factor (ECF subfamily)
MTATFAIRIARRPPACRSDVGGAAVRQSPPVEDVPAGPSDAQLVQRIADGDDAALAELYDRHGRRVYSLAMRMLRDEGRASEATQDVFVAAWQLAARFDPERAGVSTWLGTIAHSRIIDRLRREKVRSVEAPTDFAATGLDAELAQPAREGTEAIALRGTVATAVRGALAQLPPKQREAIELAYFDGLSHTEIAERIGEPVGTVKTRVFYGMRRLRDLLDEYEGEVDA